MGVQDQLTQTSNGRLGRDAKSTINGTLSYIDNVLGRTSAQLSSSRQWATEKASDTLDRTISPAQRNELSQRTQRFIETNPKLAAFISVNVILSGPPLLLFLLFSASTLAFSLTTGLVLGTISALVFTATSVGVALCVVVPTIFFTTIAASFICFWGLAGLILFKWASRLRRQASTQLNGIDGQVRNRIAQSAESAKHTAESAKQETKKFLNLDQNETQSNEKRQQPQFNSSRTTPTPLPAHTTITVSTGKADNTASTIRVPDQSTTGMVAS